MTQHNQERTLIRILRHLAEQRGMRLESMGEGWLLRITDPTSGRSRHVHGYAFDLNSAPTHAIACDKAATSELLAHQGVACVEHRLFLHTRMADFVPHRGNWEGMLKFCHNHGFNVVAKDNLGTGGRGVYRVHSALDLERCVDRLFTGASSIALSPYYEAAEEARCVILEGRVEVAYVKERPSITGDGINTGLELLAHRWQGASAARLIEHIDRADLALLTDVLPKGVSMLLNWRHNLGQGAGVRLLAEPDRERLGVGELALKTAAVMNLRFGSVDILLTADGPRVLEVNAGVMMEFLAAHAPGGEEIAARVYGRALDLMFM